MKRIVTVLLAAAGLAAPAGAVVNTRIDFQVSMDGVNWSSHISPPPFGTVLVRALVTYTGTGTPLGLASLTFQPTVSNVSIGSDAIAPFINSGVGSNTSTPPGVISGAQLTDTTSFGRVSPWGRSATSSTSALTGFFHTNPNGDGVNYLRIAQHQVTSWFGGTGNTTGGSGVSIAQLNNVGRTTSDPAFNTSLSNIYVFKFGLVLNGGNFGPEMVVDAPAAGFGNYNSVTQEREVYWFNDLNESTGSIRGTAVVNPATISLPTPASLALAGLGGLTVGRRRRSQRGFRS